MFIFYVLSASKWSFRHIKEPAYEILILILLSSNEGSAVYAHMRRLIRAPDALTFRRRLKLKLRNVILLARATMPVWALSIKTSCAASNTIMAFRFRVVRQKQFGSNTDWSDFRHRTGCVWCQTWHRFLRQGWREKGKAEFWTGKKICTKTSSWTHLTLVAVDRSVCYHTAFPGYINLFVLWIWVVWISIHIEYENRSHDDISIHIENENRSHDDISIHIEN